MREFLNWLYTKWGSVQSITKVMCSLRLRGYVTLWKVATYDILKIIILTTDNFTEPAKNPSNLKR